MRQPKYLIKDFWNLLQDRPTAILVSWFLLALHVSIDMHMKRLACLHSNCFQRSWNLEDLAVTLATTESLDG
jgi:hypothetical protein